MGPGLTRIHVQLLWWGDITGHLVLIRTINRQDAGLCEIWWSRTVSQAEVAATEFLLHEVQWQQLQTGLPIERFDLPIPMYRLSDEDDEDDRFAITQALQRPDFHLLLSLRTLTEDSVVHAVDQPVVGTHELSNLFQTTATFTPRAPSPEEPSPRAEYEVILSDVRGVMIGDDNVQINRFDITVRNSNFDLESVLARAGVRKAVAEVTMNPGDETRRQALIAALTRPGWLVSWSPARLLVTDPGTMKSAGFLASLLGFNVGVVVGDHNVQTNHFTYVTSSLPDAQSLLAGNRELAEAVAGLMFPASAASDTSTLLGIVSNAIRDLPVDFENGRRQALDLPPYHFLSLTRVDGAMVGEGNLQQYDVSVVADFDPDMLVLDPDEPAAEMPIPRTRRIRRTQTFENEPEPGMHTEGAERWPDDEVPDTSLLRHEGQPLPEHTGEIPDPHDLWHS